MNGTSAITMEPPGESAYLLRVDRGPGETLTLDVQIGSTIGSRRLVLSRNEARLWRAALGAALNSAG
jgi:hypothetical protein